MTNHAYLRQQDEAYSNIDPMSIPIQHIYILNVLRQHNADRRQRDTLESGIEETSIPKIQNILISLPK